MLTNVADNSFFFFFHRKFIENFQECRNKCALTIFVFYAVRFSVVFPRCDPKSPSKIYRDPRGFFTSTFYRPLNALLLHLSNFPSRLHFFHFFHSHTSIDPPKVDPGPARRAAARNLRDPDPYT